MPTKQCPREECRRAGLRGRPALRRVVLVRLLCAAVTAFGVASAHCASLADFGRLPALEDVALSPDGSRVAFVRTVGDERVVAAVSLNDNKPLGIVRVGDVKLRSVEWVDNRNIMLGLSKTRNPESYRARSYESLQILLYNTDSGDFVAVPNVAAIQDRGSTLINGNPMVRRLQGKTAIFVPVITVFPEIERELLKFDVETHRTEVWAHGTFSVAGWLLDADGNIAAEEDYDTRGQHWVVKLMNNGDVEKAAEGVAGLDVPKIVGFTPDGHSTVMEVLREGEVSWRPLHAGDGMGPPLAGSESLTTYLLDRFTGRMIGGVRIEDDLHYEFFDPVMRRRWNSIVHAFDGSHLRFMSASENFGKVVVSVEGGACGFCYQLVDFDTHRSKPLGDVYDGDLRPLEVRRVTYRARDGLSIPAYLTLPRSRPAERLPLVVLPHGGPGARDTAEFDWWSQAIADQGYAVLRPNYRGSTISQRFLIAGYGEYGRKMQSDLSDGVRYLAKEGIVDPQRVCIAGASY